MIFYIHEQGIFHDKCVDLSSAYHTIKQFNGTNHFKQVNKYHPIIKQVHADLPL